MTEILQSIFPIDQHVWVHNPQPHTTLSTNPSLLILGAQNTQLLALLMQEKISEVQTRKKKEKILPGNQNMNQYGRCRQRCQETHHMRRENLFRVQRFAKWAAVSEATTGGQVLFIAPHRITSLPPMVSGMPQPTPATMENIKFLYANNACEIQSYLGSLHQQPPQQLPTLIVVDAVEHYAKCTLDIDSLSVLVVLSRIFAVCQEAADFCSSANRCADTEPAPCDEPQPGPSHKPEPRPSDKSIKKDIKSVGLMVFYTQLGSSKVKLAEVEEIAYSMFQQVWTLTSSKKPKNALDIEYTLSQSFRDKAFEITFTHVDSNKSSGSSHLHLNQVALLIDEEEELEENVTEKKETIEKEKVVTVDRYDSVSNTAVHIQEVLQKYNKKL